MKENYDYLKKMMEQAQIANLPSRKIATFGETTYNYIFLGELDPFSTKLREGHLAVRIPLVIGPNATGALFNGFGKDTEQVIEELINKHGDELRLLGYRFDHNPGKKMTLKEPLKKAVLNISKSIASDNTTSLVIGERKHWHLAIFKLMQMIIRSSYQINISEFEERGVFDPKGLPPSIYEDIEHLFHQSVKNSEKQKILGAFLLEHGLFEKYEDRYFALLNSS